MEIVVSRATSKKHWTASCFFINKRVRGVGIEDEKRKTKVHGETRIDNGLYNLALRFSPKFSKSYYRDSHGNLIRSNKRNTPALKALYHTMHEMIHVTNVRNFKYILWHWGNTDLNTDGCYCVGTFFGWIRGRRAVLSSRKKYEEIYPEIWRALKNKGEKVTCKYEDI